MPCLAARTAIKCFWKLAVSLSHHCAGIFAEPSLQNCFNSATQEGFQFNFKSFKAMWKHQLDWSLGLTGPLQTLPLLFNFFFFLSHLEVNLQYPSAHVLQTHGHILITEYSSSWFSGKERNSWFLPLWRVAQVRPSHYHHNVWYLVWFSFHEMLLVLCIIRIPKP